MGKRPTLLAAAVLAGLLAGTGAAAQPATRSCDDACWNKLTRALLHAYSHYQDEDLLVVAGTAPEPVAPLLCATEGGSVLGGLQTNKIALAVVETPATEFEVVKACEARLAEAGWRRQRLESDRTGGFRSGGSYDQLWYCRAGGEQAVGVAASRVASRTIVKLALAEPSYGQICTGTGPSTGFPLASNDPALTIPDLLPPGDADSSGVIAGGASSWSVDEWRGDIGLRTGLDTVAIVEHYAKQLEAAGWSLGQRALLSEIGVQLVSATDPEGRSWAGSLSASRFAASNRYRVSLEMERLAR